MTGRDFSKKKRSACKEWSKMSLRDCTVINECMYSTKEAWTFINYLDTANINENRISEIQKLIVGKDKIPSRARRKVKLGDIVYSTVRPNQKHFGVMTHVPDNFLVSTGFSVIKGRKGLARTDFVYWFLAQSRVIKYLQAIAEYNASAYPSIRPDDIKNLKIDLPPLNEQKRIAKILFTWDKAIEMLEKLVSNAQAHKKALIQQLLTGKCRLPGFSKKWYSIKLENLGKTYGGLSGKSKEDFGFGVPFLPYSNVFENDKVDITFTKQVSVKPAERQNLVNKGDILFTISSETPNEVGMSSVVLDNPRELYLNSFCFGFRLRKNCVEKLLPEFARFYFRSPNVRRQIVGLTQGSTRYNISPKEFLKLEIRLPLPNEQKAIADILTLASHEEDILRKSLKCFLYEKHFLMSQLLTGKQRVKLGDGNGKSNSNQNKGTDG